MVIDTVSVLDLEGGEGKETNTSCMLLTESS